MRRRRAAVGLAHMSGDRQGCRRDPNGLRAWFRPAGGRCGSRSHRRPSSGRRSIEPGRIRGARWRQRRAVIQAGGIPLLLQNDDPGSRQRRKGRRRNGFGQRLLRKVRRRKPGDVGRPGRGSRLVLRCGRGRRQDGRRERRRSADQARRRAEILMQDESHKRSANDEGRGRNQDIDLAGVARLIERRSVRRRLSRLRPIPEPPQPQRHGASPFERPKAQPPPSTNTNMPPAATRL